VVVAGLKFPRVEILVVREAADHTGAEEAQESPDKAILEAQAFTLALVITQMAEVVARVLLELLDTVLMVRITAGMVEQGLRPQ
jgi:hypothetical protein